VKALIVLLLLTGAASATEKKEAFLAAKKTAAVDPAAKKKVEVALRKRLNKPAEPIVNIRNTWTKETLILSQAATVDVDQDTLDSFFRCHFTNQRPKFDKRLLAVLSKAATKFQATSIQIVSGFRAPKYNLMLRKKGHEVARNSQHTEGNAVDFRIPGVTTKELHSFVKSLRLGGVGIYPDSKFVHADVGPVRYWTGK
jgi:uncharacterized protein YcbK (DUF882 family)